MADILTDSVSVGGDSARAVADIRCSAIRLVKELYPRLKPIDEVIERYRDALANLPPIVVARDGVLVDGYHRWQAHVREKVNTIRAENLGNLSDAEIIRESIERNATHGQQLSRDDKKKLSQSLWSRFAAMGDGTIADPDDPKGKRRMPAPGSRTGEIVRLLAVSVRSIQIWTEDVRAAEKQAQQDKAWDLWLDCSDAPDIAVGIGILDATANAEERDNKARNVRDWIGEKRKSAEFSDPPGQTTKDPKKPGYWGNVQHFDVWSFATADKDAGSQSYFGAIPPQVVENLLWFYSEPGSIVVDPFAGSGTTIDVAKGMGRRVWASDIRGNHYSPHLPIHQHDVMTGWPEDAPRKADLVFLDPPYWKQASGRYSSEPNELAEMDLPAFNAAWAQVVQVCVGHAKRIAYIISPTQNDDESVVDHATAMLAPFVELGWHVERRVIVPYSTQQATGQQVTWARENKRMLKLYRDLVILTP